MPSGSRLRMGVWRSKSVARWWADRVLRFPLWPLTVLSGIAFVLLCRIELRDRRLKRQRQLGLCLKCGYNLEGNVSGVCPECGCATKA
jgi:hypothetical protein